MEHTIYKKIAVLLYVFFLAPLFAYSATEVVGDIAVDAVWTKTESPYIVHANTIILPGVTLTVEPGVVIKFNPTGRLRVEGTLNAQGTSRDIIYFTSIKDDLAGGDTNGDDAATLPAPRDWLAIYIQNSAIVHLDNVVIRYGGGGLCDICHSAGIFGTGRLYVSNSEISHNGMNGLFLSGTEGAITSTEISHQSYGIYFFNASALNIAQNSIHDNSLYGIFNINRSLVVDARNNFWGHASGPYHPDTNPTGLGDRVSVNVLFDPWLTQEPNGEPEPAQCCSNVAFIPGLQATRLELGSNRLWEPNRNADVEQLFLDDDGNPVTPAIHTDGVLDEAAGFNIYKNFISFMDELVATGTIEEWAPFPYDWRYSAKDIITNGILLPDGSTYRMADELTRLAGNSPTGKVTIITHSNGALVAKLLLSKLVRDGTSHLVDKLIMVAAPQLGTPKALAGLLHGDEQTIPSKIGVVLTKRTARSLAENMPSAYGLLPSEHYFADVLDPVIEFDEDVSDIYDFRALYGDAIESREELDAFLWGDGGARTEPDHDDTDAPNVLDVSLLSDAAITQEELDLWVPPLGVRVYQIAGWGLDTIRGIRYDDCDVVLCSNTLNHLDRELLLVHDGDGTVVIPSAVAMKDVETYYVNLKDYNKELFLNHRRNREHADILEVEYLNDFIGQIIREETFALPTFITDTKPIPKDEDKKLRFRIHSPVSLDLYDTEGNHTGLIENHDPDSDLEGVEQQIPNSYYLEFGETKYAGADAFATTTVVLVGQNTGTFTFEIDEVLGDTITASTSFRGVPVIEGAHITTSVQRIASSTVLSLDMDADGTVDAVVRPGDGVSVEELVGILRGMVRSLELPEKKEARLFRQIDKLEKALEKEFKHEKKEKVKTEKAFTKLENLIEKFEKKGLLSTDEAGELLHIIEQIKVGVVG